MYFWNKSSWCHKPEDRFAAERITNPRLLFNVSLEVVRSGVINKWRDYVHNIFVRLPSFSEAENTAFYV
jgi:hypothetical protein